MVKLYYKFLNLFNLCKHSEEIIINIEMREVPFKIILVTKDTYSCTRCGKIRYKYTYQKN